MRKTYKKHPLHAALAYSGYSLNLVQWSLLLSFGATAGFNVVVQLLHGSYTPDGYSVEETLLNPYLTPAAAPALPIEQQILLGSLAIGVGLYTVYFVGLHSSNVLKRVIGRLVKRPTAGTLWTAKLLSVSGSFLLITLVLLVLPVFYEFLPLITVMSFLAITCFCVQHLLARKNRVAYKNLA